MKENFQIALIGNPNSGKSSLFNLLTGLQQKVGNFTGVTVEKKTGQFLSEQSKVQITDLPGTYSLYPISLDERIVVDTLLNPQSEHYPDAIIYVADITKLDKQSLLLSQLIDLDFPLLWVLNMADMEESEGIKVDVTQLQQKFGIPPILKVSTKTGEGIEELRRYLSDQNLWKTKPPTTFYKLTSQEKQLAEAVGNTLGYSNTYQSLLVAHHCHWLQVLDEGAQTKVNALREQYGFKELHSQVEETMARYDQFTPILEKAIQKEDVEENTQSDRVDRFLTHPILGPIVFFVVMALVFQAIFSWANYPMDLIDAGFGGLSSLVQDLLPAGWLTDLLTDGILAGLGGVVIFIPQIAILFFLIGLLEEVGYMARVAYIWDRFMQFFGLNGRSTVALISGGACAIPAIMSARTITNRKERLITILITPFISCSARIPVYAVLIGFVVPSTAFLGVFNLQGIAFFGLYFLGILGGALVALLLKWTIKSEERSFLALELPAYRRPILRNVLMATWSKVKSFIIEAGKIILAISIVLWLAGSYGPGNALAEGEAAAIQLATEQNLDDMAKDDLIAAKKLEASYAGHFGKFIEPVIRPLGFDWKIGISLLTSFAAREVFVSTMSTIYNIGSAGEDKMLIRDRMSQELRPGTNEKVYNMATSLALLIFYVFAMQCMSTVAIIRKETGGWYWAIVIFIISLVLAYFGALVAYQLLA